MSANEAGALSPEDRAERRKMVWLFGPLFIVLVVAFFDQLLRGMNGGGLLSLVGALRAAGADTRSLDVDGASMRSVFGLAVLLPMLVFSYVRAEDMMSKPVLFRLAAGALGGAIGLSFFLGAPLVDRIMTAQGYARCTPGDYSTGSGKGRVWYRSYTRSADDCVAIARAKLGQQ